MVFQGNILIVEDTQSLALIYQESLKRHGFATMLAPTGAEALAMARQGAPDAVLLDLKLPDMDGMDILRQWKGEGLPSAVIVITGQASLNTAVEAMQLGADDFVAKPVDPERLQVTIANVLEKKKLQKIVSALGDVNRSSFCGFIGAAPDMQAVYHMIENAARSTAPVMITGESGTGKEVAAQAIHSLGARKSKPIVALNCAAIPHDLLESEIFGHVRGAFTGATADREGAASRADGGTLFLDELAEMPMGLQSKLLRFIQTGTFTPVGGSKVIHADLRFICATNRSPHDAIREGTLREDLYYRLSVIPIALPPLRERGDDILMLAEFFLEKAARQERKTFTGIDADARQALRAYRWPGNVRELENVIRHAVIMGDGGTLTTAMLSLSAARGARQQPSGIIAFSGPDDIRSLEEIERMVIQSALEACQNNITETARRLKINPATIHRKLKQWQGTDV